MRHPLLFSIPCLLLAQAAHASVFARVEGTVRDPQNHPVAGAFVTLRAVDSAFSVSMKTDAAGGFRFLTVPLGEYIVAAGSQGFAEARQPLTLLSDAAPVLQLRLAMAGARETVTVNDREDTDSMTPTTLVAPEVIDDTPGADRTNSLAMITDFVPGAYITHDQLHMRGGHQVSWELDGVPIPNTNIASNLGAQIDPRDIDYLQVERGSYDADLGDRTYGIFNVVPRSGFERNGTAELVMTLGSFFATDDQVN